MAGHDDKFARRVGDKERRMLKARREGPLRTLFGLGFFGMVGWAVTVPAAVGALVGVWLDTRYPGQRSWTLMLFVIGLLAGIFTAWRWVSNQRRRIVRESRDDH